MPGAQLPGLASSHDVGHLGTALSGLKLRMAEKAPQLTLPQAVLLLKASLPQPEFDLDKAIRIVNYYQERHEAARHSHRKK